MTGADITSHPNGLIDFTLASAVRRHAEFVLAYHEGNKRWAAKNLGVNVHTLRRILAGESAWHTKPRRPATLRIVAQKELA